MFDQDFCKIYAIKNPLLTDRHTVAYPIHSRILRLPAAHVERYDGDPDALSGLAMHVAELEPGVVLFLPRAECLLRYERWLCK